MQQRKVEGQNSSLRAVAGSLSSGHSRKQKPNRKVTAKNDSLLEKLRIGRHKCDCQARVHNLVRNCISCGRIVCEQEGSGPCFFCGSLVCTREERRILEAGTSESTKLLMKLTAGSGKDVKLDWNTATSNLLEAQAFKDKLLMADAESDKRTQVNDAESNYYSMENDIFLSKQERDAIIARKEELKEVRAKKKLSIVVDFDLANASVSETAVNEISLDKDPIIQAIFKKAHLRQQKGNAKIQPAWVPKDFVLEYDGKLGRKSKASNSDPDLDAEDFYHNQANEVWYAEVERKGFAFVLDQPVASLLALGIRRHIPWFEDTYLRGPVFIASSSRSISQDIIKQEERRCRDRMSVYSQRREFPLSYPSAAIVGRALLTDCISLGDYKQQYMDVEFDGSSESFVLIFSTFEPLLVPVPHISPSTDFYQVDKVLLGAIKQILDPYTVS